MQTESHESPSHYDGIITQFTVRGAGKRRIENISVVDMGQTVPVMIGLIAFRLQLQYSSHAQDLSHNPSGKQDRKKLLKTRPYVNWLLLNDVEISAM